MGSGARQAMEKAVGEERMKMRRKMEL